MTDIQWVESTFAQDEKLDRRTQFHTLIPGAEGVIRVRIRDYIPYSRAESSYIQVDYANGDEDRYHFCCKFNTIEQAKEWVRKSWSPESIERITEPECDLVEEKATTNPRPYELNRICRFTENEWPGDPNDLLIVHYTTTVDDVMSQSGRAKDFNTLFNKGKIVAVKVLAYESDRCLYIKKDFSSTTFNPAKATDHYKVRIEKLKEIVE